MREKELEKKLIDGVKKMGGICPKWISPGMSGVPDRIVLLPGRKIGFVEVKAPGKEPRPLQRKRMERLKALSYPVFVLNDSEQIGGILDEIRTT